MSPEEFRRHGHAVVDWVAQYWSELEKYPVTADVQPGDVATQLPRRPPQQGEPFEEMLADFERVIVPGLAHWQHPSFLGFFPMTTSGPSVLGDLLCSGLNTQGMLWSTSPACTELETVVCDWLAQLMEMPESFRGNGVIQDTASSAVLVAMAAALCRRGGAEWRERGSGPRYVMYTSTEGNCSIAKAARIVGIGDRQLRRVPVDDNFAMRPDRLRAMVEADLAHGLQPVAVVATIGTTSTTAVDPVAAIGEICRAHDLWLHVDAAYAGAAAVCPEMRWINDGLHHATSYCVNPHKWLLTGFDCDVMWTADRDALVQAMSTTPPYLREATSPGGVAIDYRDWQVPLGRRFRALKLWFVLRWYGADGLRSHLRAGLDLARQFASWVEDDERFEIVAPHPFGLVCFRLRGDDDTNARLLHTLNDSGALALSHTDVAGRYTLRMATGSPTTSRQHLEAAWHRVQTEATNLGHALGARAREPVPKDRL